MLASLCPARSRALALGLILPLAISGAALADPASWVDPPARPAAAAPEASKPPVAATPGEDGVPNAATTAPPLTPTPAANPDRTVGPNPPAPTARIGRPRRPSDAAATDDGPTRPASGGRAQAARTLAADYLASVSAPGGAMVGAAPRFYGARVRFYGRATTLAALIAQKRSFVRRWPDRRYEARTIRTACDGEGCTVRAIVDFRAASPGRGAVSRGAAELVLVVTFSGSRPVIVAETGRVLRRGAQAGTLAPVRGRA